MLIGEGSLKKYYKYYIFQKKGSMLIGKGSLKKYYSYYIFMSEICPVWIINVARSLLEKRQQQTDSSYNLNTK